MQGWQLQKECVGRVQQFAEAGQLGHDYLILVQHNPVYTLGTSPISVSTTARCYMLWTVSPLTTLAVRRRWQQRGACEVRPQVSTSMAASDVYRTSQTFPRCRY